MNKNQAHLPIKRLKKLDQTNQDGLMTSIFKNDAINKSLRTTKNGFKAKKLDQKYQKLKIEEKYKSEERGIVCSTTLTGNRSKSQSNFRITNLGFRKTHLDKLNQKEAPTEKTSNRKTQRQVKSKSRTAYGDNFLKIQKPQKQKSKSTREIELAIAQHNTIKSTKSITQVNFKAKRGLEMLNLTNQLFFKNLKGIRSQEPSLDAGDLAVVEYHQNLKRMLRGKRGVANLQGTFSNEASAPTENKQFEKLHERNVESERGSNDPKNLPLRKMGTKKSVRIVLPDAEEKSRSKDFEKEYIQIREHSLHKDTSFYSYTPEIRVSLSVYPPRC